MSMSLLVLLLLVAGQSGQSAQSAQSGMPVVVPGSTANTLRLAEGSPRPGARVTEFTWLTGSWVGEGLGGQVEEVWSAPVGGAMVGHFRLVRDGKPVFYELLTILEVEGTVEMRIKHFNPDMTAWEEKNDYLTFPLVKHDTSGAYFGPFTIHRTGPNAWEGYLAMQRDGVTVEETFTFRRKE